MTRQPAEKWKPEETQKFFSALQIFGTDFTMIEKVFNGERSREQIKNKFRKEERINKGHIDTLLINKEGITLKDFYTMYGGRLSCEVDESSLGASSSSESEENSGSLDTTTPLKSAPSNYRIVGQFSKQPAMKGRQSTPPILNPVVPVQ